MSRQKKIIAGAVALALAGTFFLARPFVPSEPSSMVEIIPLPGPLPRQFMAMARFDKPLDSASVWESLVYRIQGRDGSYGPPLSISAAGRLVLKNNNRTIFFMVHPHNLPSVGVRIRVETGGVVGKNGLPLGELGLEYLITDASPLPLYEALKEKMSVADWLALWNAWMDTT